MADIEGDGATLNLSSFESPVFTGREEDLIIAGDSLFSFSGGSGLGVGENCASFQGSPLLLSPPASFQPTASLPPTSASNTAATASPRTTKSPGAGNDGQDDSNSNENRGEAEGDKKGRFPASSLLQLLEAAVAAGDSESVSAPRPGSDPLQEQDIRAVGAPVERDKKRSCNSGDGVSNRVADASGMVADDVESEGGRGLVDGAPADNTAGNPDDPGPSPAGIATHHSSRTESSAELMADRDGAESSVPSKPNTTERKLSSMEGVHSTRLVEGRRVRRPIDHVDSPAGVVRPESASVLDRGAAVEESHSVNTEGEEKEDDPALVPSLSTTALGDGMVGSLELIPGFYDTVDSNFIMKALLQSSETQPHAVDNASRLQSHKKGTEEGQTKQAEPRAPIAVGDLEEANEVVSGITGCPVTSDDADVLKGRAKTPAFEQSSVIAAPNPPPLRVPPPSPQGPSGKSLEPNPRAMQRSPSPTPVPTPPLAQVPSVLSPTPSTSDPDGEPSDRPPASRESVNPEQSSMPHETPKAPGPLQSLVASGDCAAPSVDVRTISGGDGSGGCSFPSQATSIGGERTASAGNLALVRAAEGGTGDRCQSSQALEAQASSGNSEKKKVDVEGSGESRESAEIQIERPPLPRKVALRFTPRDHATQEKVAQHGYNPAQQLKAPLYKPIDAVFKFMLKKWGAVSYGDLSNIRIVFDGGVGPLMQEFADGNRGGADAGKSGTESGPPATTASDAYVWDPARSTETLIDLVESLPEATRDHLCKHQVLDLTYTFVPGQLGPRQPLLPNRHMGNMVPPAGGSSIAAPGDGALSMPAETTASTPENAVVVNVTAVPEGRSKPLVTDIRSPAGNAAAHGQMVGQSSRPKRLTSRASSRPATGQQPAKASRGGRRMRGSREMASMGPRNKPGDGHVPGLSRPDVGCERSHGIEARSKSGNRAAKESRPLQAASPRPSGFLAQMHTAAVASGIEGQVGASFENPAAPASAPSSEPTSKALAYPGVTPAASGPGNATSVVPSMLPPKDAPLPAEDPMVELEQIINQGNLDGSSRIGEVDIADDNALMGEETCMALFGGSDARVELLVDPASRRVEGDVPRNEGQASIPSETTASVDPAAADGRSPGLPSSALFSAQPSALTTMSREARRDRMNGSNSEGSDFVTAGIAPRPASCVVHTPAAVQERILACDNTARPRPGALTALSAREPQQPSVVTRANPVERRGSSSSEAPAAASRDARPASDRNNLKTSRMKPPPPVPPAQLPALQAHRESATEVTGRRNGGAVAPGGMKGQSQPVILSPGQGPARSSTPRLERPQMEPVQNGGGEPAMMGNTGGAESRGKGKAGEGVVKLPEAGHSEVGSPGVVTHAVSKESSAIGGVTKRRRADGEDPERPNKKECIPGVTRSPRQQVGQNSSLCSARDVESETPGTPKVAAALKPRPFAFAAAKNAERSQGGSVKGNDGGLEGGKAGTTEMAGVCESPILSPSAVVTSFRAQTPSQFSPRTSERHSVLPSSLCSFSPLWPATTASIDLSDIPTPTMMKEIQAGDGDAMACFPGLLWNMSNSGCDEEAESPKCEGPITRWLGLSACEDPGVGGSPERDTTAAAGGEQGAISQPDRSVPPSSIATAVAPEEEGSKTLPTLIRLGRSMTKGLSLLPSPSELPAAGKDGPKAPPPETPSASSNGKDDRGGAEVRKYVGKHSGSGEREGDDVTVAGVSCGRRGGDMAQSKVQAPASSTTSSSRSGSKGAVESKPKRRAKKHRITPTLVSNVLPSTSAGLADTGKVARAALPSLTPGGVGSGMRIVNDRDSEGSKAS